VIGINLASSLFYEGIGDRPSDADGLWCTVRANRSDDLEQPFSNYSPADRVIIVKNRNPDLPWQAIVECDVAAKEFNHCNCLKSKVENHMSIEQNPTQWVDSQVQRQTGATNSRKSARLARSRRQGDRREPLNVLGCLALIHAVRSVDSGNRSRVSARRATTA
jgi:hypothetical protein